MMVQFGDIAPRSKYPTFFGAAFASQRPSTTASLAIDQSAVEDVLPSVRKSKLSLLK